MKLLRARTTLNVQRHWNHVGFFAKLAHDACVAVLHERAHGLGGIDNFESI